MQPLQRHLLSSDDDKVPVEFIWQSNFPCRDLENFFFFPFFSLFFFKVRRTSGGLCCWQSFGLRRKTTFVCVVSNRVGRCGGRDLTGVIRVFCHGPRCWRSRRTRMRGRRRWLQEEVVEHAVKEETVKLEEEEMVKVEKEEGEEVEKVKTEEEAEEEEVMKVE